MRVLGLVPARGGSKGVPRKNIRLLGGRPLLAYTADAALGATRLDRVVLSTDDPEVASIGRDSGLDTPFLRPAELATDDTPTLPVVQHALDHLAGEGHHFDAVCLLQPTSPFREPDTIDRCVDLLERSGADSVLTMLPVPDHHNPHWVYERDPTGRLRIATGEDAPLPRRQDLPPAFHREGSVYVTRAEVVLAGSLYGTHIEGVLVDERASVNIDTLDDWARAEAMIEYQP